MRKTMIVLLCTGLLGSLILAAGPAAAVIHCNTYYDSTEWNRNSYPNEGGCWLSGAVCYECYEDVSYESAGCNWSDEDCRRRLAGNAEPFQDVRLEFVDGKARLVWRVCTELEEVTG